MLHIRTSLLAASLIAVAPGSLTTAQTQTFGNTETSILTRDVTIETAKANATSEMLAPLLETSGDVADEIRIMTNPEKVTLVQLGERRDNISERIAETLRDYSEPLRELRHAIQINAIVTQALNEQQIGVPEVIGASMAKPGELVIFAFAKQESDRDHQFTNAIE